MSRRVLPRGKSICNWSLGGRSSRACEGGGDRAGRELRDLRESGLCSSRLAAESPARVTAVRKTKLLAALAVGGQSTRGNQADTRI